MAKGTCSIEGCDRTHHAQGWCAMHHRRWLRHGSPDLTFAGHEHWVDRLLQRMEPQPNGCIYYAGPTNRTGYGLIKFENGTLAHRAAYEHFVGPIPDGMTIDHECHNRDESCAGGDSCLHRRCVNPEHLAVKSRGENVLASPNTFQGKNLRKTHCPQGHPYDEANTKITVNGSRRCRACYPAKHSRGSQD